MELTFEIAKLVILSGIGFFVGQLMFKVGQLIDAKTTHELARARATLFDRGIDK